NFIYYYLLDRKVVFKDGTLEIERDCHKGCPQGSVVAPNLWNIYVNRVLEINSERVFLQAFADDLALVTAGSVRKELEINTNEALELIHLTLVESKLELSVGKCQGLAFRSLNTVFQAELAALGEAVDWAIENKKKINIYTDSRSSIEAHKSYGSRSKFVISIKNKFCLAEGLVAWVKAHVGIPGNELADHFAKLARVEGEGMDIPFPYSLVKFTLKKKLLEDWQIYYGAYETASGNRIRGFVPRVDTKTLIKSKYLIYFLTGHGPFPCYLSRFKILSSSLCECGLLGDPDHYLFDCLMTRDHHLKKPSCEAKSLWLKNVMSTAANHEKLVNCFKVSRVICDRLSRV
ncbi:hypothetical protein AVEN_65827-2-1, partial [Araneus ventricosus]